MSGSVSFTVLLMFVIQNLLLLPCDVRPSLYLPPLNGSVALKVAPFLMIQTSYFIPAVPFCSSRSFLWPGFP